MELHLSDAEFYGLTPRQLNALIARLEEARRPMEFMLAQLTAYTINFSARGPKQPVAPRDFMPSLMEANRERTEQEEAEMWRTFARQWNKQFRKG